MPSRTEYWKNPEKYRSEARAYAKSNPDWKKKANSEWLKTPKGKAFSRKHGERQRLGWTEEQRAARSAYQREWFTANPDYNREKLAEYKAKRPERNMVWAAKTRAAKLGVPFDLDWRGITIPATCPVLGVPLRQAKKGESRRGSPSLDRLIPSLGYVQSNVRVISHEANQIKQDFTLGYLRERADRLRGQLSGVELVIAYLERETA